MSRLTDFIDRQNWKAEAGYEPDKLEGDSADTEIADDNDTPPGIDPRAGDPKGDR